MNITFALTMFPLMMSAAIALSPQLVLPSVIFLQRSGLESSKSSRHVDLKVNLGVMLRWQNEGKKIRFDFFAKKIYSHEKRRFFREKLPQKTSSHC